VEVIMIRVFGWFAAVLVVGVGALLGVRTLGATVVAPFLEPPAHASAALLPTPVVDWSLEAQRAIVPPPAGVGNKFPGEAAVYMGIVHAAMYDAAVAIEGGFRPYAIALIAPADTSSAAAIATAAHGVLVGLLPMQRADLVDRYEDYLAALPDDTAKTNGIRVGEQVANAVLALRTNDGREANPQFVQPPPGPGVYEPDPAGPVLGLRLSTMRPLALNSPWQFRPDGPNSLTSEEYAVDFEQVKAFGRFDSEARNVEQTTEALFWTDHDLRQWNEGMLRLAASRGLDFIQTARMLAMAHVSGGDAMIACFDAKYYYLFWRPVRAIPLADTDANPATGSDPIWRPLRPTPNHPEYPSAHACHTSAVAEALRTFFGTDEVNFVLDSRATGTTREYGGFREAVRDVNRARVLAGFHFRNSDQEGTKLGRKVGRFIVGRFFQALDCADGRLADGTSRGTERRQTQQKPSQHKDRCGPGL
jgi:hypothetical protein